MPKLHDISGTNNVIVLANGAVYNTSEKVISGDIIDDGLLLPNTLSADSWTFSQWYKFNYPDNLSRCNVTINGLNNTEGTVISNYIIKIEQANQILVDSDDSIFIVSNNYAYQGFEQAYITKIQSNGLVDTNFQDTTWNTHMNVAQSITNIVVDSDYYYFAGLNLTPLQKRDKYTNELILELSYTIFDAGNGNKVIAIDKTRGWIYVAGPFTTINGYSRTRLARFNTSDLTLDTTFDTSNGFNTIPSSAVIDESSGQIYVFGGFNSYKGTQYGIVRLNIDGSKDTSFVGGNSFSRNVMATYGKCLLTSGNKLLLYYITSGWVYDGYTITGGIIQLNLDGTRDTGFVGYFGTNQYPKSIVEVEDGKLLCGGYFWSVNGVYLGNRITKLNSDGTRDTGFTGAFTAEVNCVAMQSNGKYLFSQSHGASNVTYNGATVKGFGRINSDGSYDTTFQVGDGVTDTQCYSVMYFYIHTAAGVRYTYTLGAGGGFPHPDFRYPGHRFREYFNQWHFNTYVFDNVNKTIKLYLDGQLYRTYSPGSTYDLSLKNANMIYTRDEVGEVSFYDRVLSSKEITQNYNALKSRYGL